VSPEQPPRFESIFLAAKRYPTTGRAVGRGRRTSGATRATGGVADPEAPDVNSTTGTTPNDVHVGRAQGQDVGYAGETGAERRAAAE
jgi:hypothetical protein